MEVQTEKQTHLLDGSLFKKKNPAIKKSVIVAMQKRIDFMEQRLKGIEKQLKKKGVKKDA